MDLAVALISETWLKNNYERVREEIEDDKGLQLFARNRVGKKVGGGVCMVVDKKKMKLEEKSNLILPKK